MRRLSVLLASVVMALTLVAFAVATGASAQPQAQQQAKKFYSAVYEGTTAFYYGDGTSKAKAIEASRRRCEAGDTGCAGVAWIYNGWIVIAQGNTQQGGVEESVGLGPTKQQAVANAMEGCQQPPPLTGCQVIGSHRTVAYDKNKPFREGKL